MQVKVRSIRRRCHFCSCDLQVPQQVEFQQPKLFFQLPYLGIINRLSRRLVLLKYAALLILSEQLVFQAIKLYGGTASSSFSRNSMFRSKAALVALAEPRNQMVRLASP